MFDLFERTLKAMENDVDHAPESHDVLEISSFERYTSEIALIL